MTQCDSKQLQFKFKTPLIPTSKIKRDKANNSYLQSFYLKNGFKSLDKAIISTFRGGLKEPLHSWFPYLEGYSPDFVKTIIHRYAPQAKLCYDPFAGSGTTPITSSKMGLNSFYSEINPLMRVLIDTKSKILSLKVSDKNRLIRKLTFYSENITSIKHFQKDECLAITYNKVFNQASYFSNDIFDQILRSKSFLQKVDDMLVKQILEVSILGIILDVSLLKRHGDIRFKTEKELKGFKPNFFDSLKKKLQVIIHDIALTQRSINQPILLTQDAKISDQLPHSQFDIIITSPPYINGTNYIRNTKLELWFLEFLKIQSELKNFRLKTITAGINDVQKCKNINNVHFTLNLIWSELSSKSYDVRIPKMVNNYFFEMESVIKGLASSLKKDGILAIDIGDSIYAGVRIPVFDAYKSIAERYKLNLIEDTLLRIRYSKNKMKLKQVLLVFQKNEATISQKNTNRAINQHWIKFKTELPHQRKPFNKRNWGHSRHSLCSYQGKLKPAIG